MAGASPIAPGAHIEVRDAVWRVLRVDQTSGGPHAGQSPQANLGSLDLGGLQALLPDAVERVGAAVRKDRDEIDAVLQERLRLHRERMGVLRDRQDQQVRLAFADKRGTRARDKRAKEERRIQRLFDDVDRWARDALTTEPRPYLQVIACICGRSWRAGAAT